MFKNERSDQVTTKATALSREARSGVLGKKKRKLGKRERLERRKAKEISKTTKAVVADTATPIASRKSAAGKVRLEQADFSKGPVRWFSHEKAKRQEPLPTGVVQADEDTIHSAKQKTQILLCKLVEDVEREEKQRK